MTGRAGSLRRQVALALAPALVALAIGVGVIADGAADRAADTAAAAAAAGALDDLSNLTLAVSRERSLSLPPAAGGSTGSGDTAALRAGARDAVDEALPAALDALSVAAARAEQGTGPARAAADALVTARTRAVAANAALTALRSTADGDRPAPSAADLRSRWNAVQAAYLRALDTVAAVLGGALAAGDRQRAADVAAAALATANLAGTRESLALERTAGLVLLRAARPGATADRAFAVALAGTAADLGRARRATTPGLRTLLDRSLEAPAAGADQVAALRRAFTAAPPGTRPAVSEQAWTTAVAAQEAALTGVITAVAADAGAAAEAAAGAARTTARSTTTAAAAGLLLLVGLALAGVARALAPLRRLTAAADDLAADLPALVAAARADDDHDPLPADALPDGGSSEVRRLAAALGTIGERAVVTAREQARQREATTASFVNVARRTHVLLSRQLAFIDQLERAEEDPDTLADLFRLDHLATRMRRNAESLLVLAGVDSGRRPREAMPLSAVVRAAAGEIEHYPRVDLALQVDPAVHAHVALPLAHLLAELLENATTFSDPAARVLVGSAVGGDHVLVTVADDGLGVSPDDLVQLNAQLSAPPAVGAFGAQRLGLAVVARLAERLGARVSLHPGRPGGMVAAIEVPLAVFTADAVAPTDRQPPVGRPMGAARPGGAADGGAADGGAADGGAADGGAADGGAADGGAADGGAADGGAPTVVLPLRRRPRHVADTPPDLVPERRPGLTGSTLFSGFRPRGAARAAGLTAAAPPAEQSPVEQSPVEQSPAGGQVGVGQVGVGQVGVGQVGVGQVGVGQVGVGQVGAAAAPDHPDVRPEHPLAGPAPVDAAEALERDLAADGPPAYQPTAPPAAPPARDVLPRRAGSGRIGLRLPKRAAGTPSPGDADPAPGAAVSAVTRSLAVTTPSADGPVPGVPAPGGPGTPRAGIPVVTGAGDGAAATAAGLERSALASEALTELSRLSSWSPAGAPAAPAAGSDAAGLRRRTTTSGASADEPTEPDGTTGRTDQ